MFVLWNPKGLTSEGIVTFSTLKFDSVLIKKTKLTLLFFQIFKAALRLISPLLRKAREGTKN